MTQTDEQKAANYQRTVRVRRRKGLGLVSLRIGSKITIDIPEDRVDEVLAMAVENTAGSA